MECARKNPHKFVSLRLVRFFNLNFICYHSKFDYNVLFLLGVQGVIVLHIYIYLFIFGSISHVGYDTMLSSLLSVFRRSLVLIYFTCVGISLFIPIS